MEKLFELRTIKNTIKKITLPIFRMFADHFDFIVAPHIQGVDNIENTSKTIIHSPVEFIRTTPMHLGSLHKKFFNNAPGITASSEETFLRILDNAKVFGENGCVISNNNILSADSESKFAPLAKVNNSVFFKKPIEMKGVSILLAGHDSSHNYFHWMTDALPKLSIAQSASNNIDNIENFIVSNNDFPFQRETLAYLKIPCEKTISLAKGKYLVCEKLIAPSATCLSGNVSQWILEYLRKVFRDWMTIDESLPPKFFVSRKHAQKRVLKNEDELQQCLKMEGFTIVYLEDLSVKQQVQYFYNAKEIIGAHGAGFTNLIFSQKGTKIIELFPVTYVNQCYWTIASINNLKYGYVLGEGIDVTNSTNHLIDADFYISVENVIALNYKMND